MRNTDSIIHEIASERVRQVKAKGYTAEGDDIYTAGDLAQAAAAYALHDSSGYSLETWPWPEASFKPKDARRNLIRAGALIVAEVERLDRLAAKKGGAA